MEQKPDGDPSTAILDQLRRVEERLARIEAHLDLRPDVETLPAGSAASDAPQNADREALEFELGQNWFAKLGIVVVAIGFAFALTFHYRGAPSAVPGLVGALIAGAVFFLAHIWRSSFVLVSSYLRGAALALLYFSALRLSFFGEEAAVPAGSPVAVFLLMAVTAITVFVSLRRSFSLSPCPRSFNGVRDIDRGGQHAVDSRRVNCAGGSRLVSGQQVRMGGNHSLRYRADLSHTSPVGDQ